MYTYLIHLPGKSCIASSVTKVYSPRSSYTGEVFEITMTPRPLSNFSIFVYGFGYGIANSLRLASRLEEEESNDKTKLHVYGLYMDLLDLPTSATISPFAICFQGNSSRSPGTAETRTGVGNGGEFDKPNGGSLSDNVEARAKILSKRSRKTSLED